MSDIKEKTLRLIDGLKATCQSYGMGNDGNEYKIITQVFLYKFLNDKFGYELKNAKSEIAKKLTGDVKWETAYENLSDDERMLIQSAISPDVPMLEPYHLIANLWNQQGKGDFDTIFDSTMTDIAEQNADIFSKQPTVNTKIPLFEALTPFVPASAKYAEYYTPHAIATIMARLLVGDNADLHSMECYDPSAGTGTLLMALSHQIGEERCTIFSQDISQRSNKMLKLNLLLNGLVSSLDNAIQGDTLVSPYHKSDDGQQLRQFDFVVSNPPFKMDFSDTREKIAAMPARFWAGVPNVPAKKKESMAIYTCFIQHVINSLKKTGKGAIVIPTGFITAKSGIENKILHKIVDDKVVFGCVSMPSNVFANTGTNVSVLFFDKAATTDKLILIDASKLGEEYKDANGLKKVRLNDDEIEKIVGTFQRKEAVEDFSVAVSYDEIKEKGYSLSAGQYFDIKIDYVDITEEEFNARMANYKQTLTEQFKESHRLEEEIMKQLDALRFNANVGNNE